MAYIKNRSNFVKQTKHQLINSGSIWERDITTIGGLNSFNENQTPIYQSSNFILTVNNENNVSKYFQKQNWEENNTSEVWTLNNINIETNDGDTDDTLKIVLKPDYYNLKSFAYYGSCVELIRASVSNIAKNFPGELYFESGTTVYYETKEKGEITSKVLGGDNLFLVDNPFNLDIHTETINVTEQESTPLKYIAANKNWEKYELITTSGRKEITSITINKEDKDCFKSGDKLAEIIINEKIVIQAYMNVGNEVTYLASGGTSTFSIRPKETYLNQFFKSLDAFESILMNKNSDPKYTAILEVTKENDFTLETSLQSFTFPTTHGGYNLAVNTVKYEHYIDSLAQVASFYDEYYCDNLYRCMTHESIKNFDFSYTRSYEDGQTDAYIEGGEKFQNTLRLIAREFDEIKYYIDNLRNSTRITYDNIGNIPDYFLTDTLDVEGWDIINTYPLSLTESFYIKDTKYIRINDSRKAITIDEDGKSTNINVGVNESGNTVTYAATKYPLTRTFNQDLTLKITPYSKNNFKNYPNGYFLVCDCGQTSRDMIDGVGKYSENFPYSLVLANKNDQYIYDDCAQIARLRIKPYTSEKEYTMNEVNNHFMKMLKLNSRYILRHKGTIKGIEMLLSLFGLKSKEYIDKSKNSIYNPNSGRTYDYEIVEKTTFMKPLVDKYNEKRGEYEIDWYNSTKSIAYSSEDYLSGIYNSYQGLPVAYDEITNNDTTVRVLFPYFNKEAEIDGKPYYQMNGGWLRKSPYKFDKNNNIIPKTSYTETLDNVQSVKNLQELLSIKLQYLTDSSIVHVKDLSQDYIIVDGEVYPILSEMISGKTYHYIALNVLNQSVKLGKTIYRNDVWVSNPHISVLQQEEGQHIPLYLLSDNETIKVYLIEDETVSLVKDAYKFWDGDDTTHSVTNEFGTWEYVYDDSTKTMTITHKPFEPYIKFNEYSKTYSTFAIFSGGSQISYEIIKEEGNERYKQVKIENPSHYFKLNSLNNKMELGGNGWNQLSIDSDDYRIINTIVNNFKGNNPHRGNLKYDNGYEYISYFTKLFKYAINNNKFDARCYSGKEDYTSSLTVINDIGFAIASGNSTSEAITVDDSTKFYKTYRDSKIHYFGNKYIQDINKVVEKEITTYNGISPILLDSTDSKEFEKTYSTLSYSGTTKMEFSNYSSGTTTPSNIYTIFDSNEVYSGFSGESKISGYTLGYSEQIVNTKVVDIIFYIDKSKKEYSSHNLITTKYLDSVIIPYLTQMIPSNTILNIEFKYA